MKTVQDSECLQIWHITCVPHPYTHTQTHTLCGIANKFIHLHRSQPITLYPTAHAHLVQYDVGELVHVPLVHQLLQQYPSGDKHKPGILTHLLVQPYLVAH